MCESRSSSSSTLILHSDLVMMEDSSSDSSCGSSEHSKTSASTATTTTTRTSTSSQDETTEDGNGVILLSSALQNLSLATQRHGEVHESVAEAWNSLGLIRLHMQQDCVQARVCHEHALSIYTQLQRPIESAITCHDLGYCHEMLLERDTAMKYYERALNLLRQTQMNSSHPRMIATQRSMNRLLRA